MDEPHVWLASGDDDGIKGGDDQTDENGDPIVEEIREDDGDNYEEDSRP